MCLKKIFSGRTTNLQAPQLHYAAGQFCIPATTGNVKNMQPYDPLFCSLLEKLQKGHMYPYSRTILTCFWWRNFLTGNHFRFVFVRQQCRLSKYYWRILYSKLVYKLGHYFLDYSPIKRSADKIELQTAITMLKTSGLYLNDEE